MTTLTFTQDTAGFNSFGLPFASDNRMFTLPATTKKTVTAPTNNTKGYAVVFYYEPGAKVWVQLGDVDITLPTATPATTSAQLNPAVRQVPAGSTLSFKTNDTSVEVGVSFYALN
jgi:hypothetical protein